MPVFWRRYVIRKFLRLSPPQQSWDVAITPGKSIFMNLFMLWMMGSGGIFAFIMVGYAVMQSFSSLMRVHDGMLTRSL